ncbi:ATP-binding protein [Lactobacillus sp. PFC-70]|nr:ATP-binding protein [Lactobacillus sp. PFC-70]
MGGSTLIEQGQIGLELSTHLVKQIIEKNYLTTLGKLTPIRLESSDFMGTFSNVRMYKIDEIVYTKNENVFQKLTNVFNALAIHKSSVFLLIDAHKNRVDLYLGVRQVDANNSIVTSAETLRKAIQGQFPGTKLTNVINPKIRTIQKQLNQYQSVAVASGIPELKNKDFGKNENFVQGIEKFIDTMQGEQYQTVILAENLTENEILDIRTQYENIYSRLSSMQKLTINTSEGTSFGISEGKTNSTSHGVSESENQSYTITKSKGISMSHSQTKPTEEAIAAAKKAKAIKAVGAVVDVGVKAVGAAVAVSTAGASSAAAKVGKASGQAILNVAKNADKMAARGAGIETATKNMEIGSGIASYFATESEKKSEETQTDAKSTNVSQSEGHTSGTTTGTTDTRSTGYSTTQSSNKNQGRSATQEFENKTIINMLKRLDQQFERIDDFSDTSAWNFAAYFLSNQPDAVEIASATYQSIMSGENTGIQVSAVNTWHMDADKTTQDSLDEINVRNYIANFLHPQFVFNDVVDIPMMVDPTSIISSEELGLALSLPRQSVSGIPVIEQVKFAKSIATVHNQDPDRQIRLGKIAPGKLENSRDFEPEVAIDIPSLASHTFITGSTGTGKSNTVYAILGQLLEKNVKFCVIEPAKGEYKNVFGNRPDINVYGTNPNYTPLLRINPFAFPKGIHIFEHIDRLIEIFNVSWPMYAAMPAILKEAVILAYQRAGWDLKTSINQYGDNLFPDFTDLIDCLKITIEESDYSSENKGNYTGSLVTRIKSLTNGLNGMILTEDEISLTSLFDENTIIDLSRVGSTETKSLLMGILIMRLNEYRMDNADGMNQRLKHVTVLEEAHNILGSASSAGPEGAGVQQKSVQLLTSAIAEMRTYGEGFMIVDQSPSSVDIAAIKNTNTKIVMRIPEESDRNLVGKAAALSDEQLKELALLHKGEAVVYQNDWLEPALVNIMDARQTGIEVDGVYQYQKPKKMEQPELTVSEIAEIGKVMVYALVNNPLPLNTDVFHRLMNRSILSASDKVYLTKTRQIDIDGKGIVSVDLGLLSRIFGIETISDYYGKVQTLYSIIFRQCQDQRLTRQLLALIDRYLKK